MCSTCLDPTLIDCGDIGEVDLPPDHLKEGGPGILRKSRESRKQSTFEELVVVGPATD